MDDPSCTTVIPFTNRKSHARHRTFHNPIQRHGPTMLAQRSIIRLCIHRRCQSPTETGSSFASTGPQTDGTRKSRVVFTY